MNDPAPDPNNALRSRELVDEPVIHTAAELVEALVTEFLTNADAGDHALNDALIAHLAAWRNGRDH